MRRILACLILLLALAAMPMKADAATLPNGAVLMWNNGDYAFYSRGNVDVVDYGWYFTVDLIEVPVSSKEIKKFRKTAGFNPGYVIITYAFDRYAPKGQTIKLAFYGEMGEYDSFNSGLDPNGWDEVKNPNFLVIWKTLTGNK